MQIKEYLRRKILGMLGLAKYEGKTVEERLTFINDAENLVRSRICEYNIWYGGDGDELLNYYTHEQMLNYNTVIVMLNNKMINIENNINT